MEKADKHFDGQRDIVVRLSVRRDASDRGRLTIVWGYMKEQSIQREFIDDEGNAGGDCLPAGQTRRDFLGKSSSIVLAALIAAGASPEDAAAFPVYMVSASMEEA